MPERNRTGFIHQVTATYLGELVVLLLVPRRILTQSVIMPCRLYGFEMGYQWIRPVLYSHGSQ